MRSESSSRSLRTSASCAIGWAVHLSMVEISLADNEGVVGLAVAAAHHGRQRRPACPPEIGVDGYSPGGDRLQLVTVGVGCDR